LASALLGLAPQSLPADARLVNEGGLAEQLVGQALRAAEPYFKDRDLFYWENPSRGAEAELDYVLAHAGRIVPLEVKAGKTGTLKSLHLFMALRALPLAVRLDASPPSRVRVQTTTRAGRAEYELLSLPLYMAGHLQRWLDFMAQTAPPAGSTPHATRG
jgi:hypothetical protein